MCQHLVLSSESFNSEDDKKKFEEKTRLEITRKKKNAVIQFVCKDDKNYEKTIERYHKKHPNATVHGSIDD